MKDIVGKTPDVSELGALSVHDVRALELTGRFMPKPGGDGVTHAFRHDSVSRTDERAGEDGPAIGTRLDLPSEVHVELSAAGQVSPSECQPEFARTRQYPFVVSEKSPAPAAFQAPLRNG